ncbi:hypothetical protein OG21DRAFT_1494727 [Imleria badia]|nr:hypothetical protein OG21DRAFT_1494727 [Imleria badia]
MKRGFLNTPRAKRLIEEASAPRSPPEPPRQPKTSSPPSSRRTQDGGADPTVVKDTTSAKSQQQPEGNDPKGKGKAKAVEIDVDKADSDSEASSRGDSPAPLPVLATAMPPRPPPGRPGWGHDPKEDFFHLVPESLGGPHRKRAVFCFWPRDPKGKILMPLTDRIRGTLSPDGYAWGETLYDLFYVNRVPYIPNSVSTITGSALREAMEELGELDAAADLIEWSKSEGKPRVLGVANTEELIRCIDKRVHLPCCMKGEEMSNQDEEQDDEDDNDDGEDGDEEDHDGEDEQASEHGVEPIFIPPTIPVTSPFHPSHYPKPWSFVPFSNPLSILLQERVSLYLLPQTLYVHDPFCLLPARKRRFPDTSWTSRPDIIRTYNLNLSESVHREVEAARVTAEELEEFKARTLIIMRYQRTKEQIKNCEPMIDVPLPPYQRRMTKVEESHLYLSPVAKVGEGHHSIVYKGEWELPREIFTKTTICSLCFKESAEKEIQRLKDTGRWQKLMKAAGCGPKGHTGRELTQAELDEVKEPPNLARDGEIIERKITCFVPPNIAPAQVVEFLEKTDIWGMFMKKRSSITLYANFTQDDEDESEKHSRVIRIDPPFSYESQKSCTHTANRPVPQTAKFTVVAKLSLEHDLHLAGEAGNYQNFPEHFFHHYNGYTVIKQLHTIVPVNAIVPQFYGYYVPKKDEANPGQPSYLSPILLLEHCGNPIDPEELSDEDQEECASMLLRFQQAGWLHESVALRNFLVQLGKPTEFPLVRDNKPETSFRLIDFGRSRKYETAKEKQGEEMEALRMFERLCDKMAVTLSM